MPIVHVEDTFYRYEATAPGKGSWVPADAEVVKTTTEGGRAPVKVSAAEWKTIGMGGDHAVNTLLVAESRGRQLAQVTEYTKSQKLELDALGNKSATGDIEAKRQKLVSNLDKAHAVETMLEQAQKQAPIDAALVAKIGDAPHGYVREGDSFVYDAKVAEKQMALSSAELRAVDKARAAYERDLAELYRTKEAIDGNKSLDATKKAVLEQERLAAAAKVRDTQAAYTSVEIDPAKAPDVAKAKLALGDAERAATTTGAVKPEAPTALGSTKEVPAAVKAPSDVVVTAEDEAHFKEMFAAPSSDARFSPERTLGSLLKDAAKARAAHPAELAGLSELEVAALLGYTSSDASALNRALRLPGIFQLHADAAVYQRLVEGALSKLAGRTFSGEVVRIGNYDPALVANLKPGAFIEDTGFLSTSAGDVEKFTGNTRLEITSKTGERIDFISVKPDELEVLFRPGAVFQVDEVGTIVGADGKNVMRIKLTEVARVAVAVDKLQALTPESKLVVEAAKSAGADAALGKLLEAERGRAGVLGQAELDEMAKMSPDDIVEAKLDRKTRNVTVRELITGLSSYGQVDLPNGLRRVVPEMVTQKSEPTGSKLPVSKEVVEPRAEFDVSRDASGKVELGKVPDYVAAEAMLRERVLALDPDATVCGSYVRTEGGTKQAAGKPFKPFAWPKGFTYEEALALTKTPSDLDATVVKVLPADVQRAIEVKKALGESYR